MNLTCPHCKKTLPVLDHYAKTWVNCCLCRQTFDTPFEVPVLLEVTAPRSTRTTKGGEAMEIKWKAQATEGAHLTSFAIDLCLAGGVLRSIPWKSTYQESYTWNIPEDLPDGALCEIKVKVKDNQGREGHAVADGQLSIKKPLTLLGKLGIILACVGGGIGLILLGWLVKSLIHLGQR